MLLAPSRIIVQLAFMMDGGSAVHHSVIAEMSRGRGVAPPERDARHHAMPWAGDLALGAAHGILDLVLGWPRAGKIRRRDCRGSLRRRLFATRLADLGRAAGNPPENGVASQAEAIFEPTSLCHSDVRDGQAAILTDFRQDRDGLTQILVIDRGLSDYSRGALVQRLLDIETYRTLAMLGLPMAQTLSPEIRRIEDGLTGITQRMKNGARDEADALLAEMTRLAAELEANAALSLYRFGASRAYDGIVRERIRALAETPVQGHETMGSFLERRMAPAMRTCQSVEERQANLSRKLYRATALVRSWIDVELERQNTVLLNTMNKRAAMQLRLQQTVEGLSVAAVSYYVVGLIGYLTKAISHDVLPVDPAVVTGLSVPLAVLGVWWVVRRVRRSHVEGGH